MKTNKIPKHTQVPNSQENEYKILKIGDRLVYCALKRYMNKDTFSSYPKIETIAEDCGCSVGFVKLSVERLIKVGWLKVTRRPGASNVYVFTRPEKFEMFSDDFFKLDLDYRLKDFYIQLQQYLLKDPVNNRAYIRLTNNEIADKLHLSLKTVQKYVYLLKANNIIEERITSLINPETHCEIIEKVFNLSKIEQAFLYKIVEHDKDIQNAKKDIQETKDEVSELKERVAELERLLNKRTWNGPVSFSFGKED